MNCFKYHIAITVGIASVSLLLYYNINKHKNTKKDKDNKDNSKLKSNLNVNSIKKYKKIHKLINIPIPKEFQISFYFPSLSESTIEHYTLFTDGVHHVFQIIDHLHSYLMNWLGNKSLSDFKSFIHNNNEISKCTFIDINLKNINNENIRNNLIFIHPDNNNSHIILDKIVYNSYSNNSENQNFYLIIDSQVQIFGGIFDISKGSIYIGKKTIIESGVHLSGPIYIGNENKIRFGAYIRDDTIIENNCCIRSEIKHSIILNHAELCHPGYCGDSIIGHYGHFGNQVTTANLPLLTNIPINNIMSNNKENKEILITINNQDYYNIERKKMGIIMGDHSQLGCNVVTDPGTLISYNTYVYSLTRLNKGIYGPNQIIKNKPMENGIVEITNVW